MKNTFETEELVKTPVGMAKESDSREEEQDEDVEDASFEEEDDFDDEDLDEETEDDAGEA